MESIIFILTGLIVVLIGFILIIVGSLLQTKTRTESGGAIIIGPFPIIWGTNKTMFWIACVVAIISLLIIVLVNLSGR